MPALVAEGLVRAYAGMRVLAGVDLTVEAGETLALLGPNGAGKTTLLRVFALLLRPSEGRLTLFGIDARSAPPELRRRLGYLAHESFCYPDLSGAENLAFHARLFDVAAARERIGTLLAWAGLEAAGRRPVRIYSRGTSQRLALARALLPEPVPLLLDEPFSGLDPAAVEALQERLVALREAGRAIVLTTHDLDRAAPIATRTAILHRGRIASVLDGRAADAVAAAYRTVVAGGR